MAKELFIVFVYDTEVFLREEEDPQRAIVFFHPSWVSANRRMALCGQLMGVTQFLVTDFTFPRLISLGNGKFTMRKIGRFILCVGTDRNIPDWILSKRCEILYHTLQFFHANLTSFDNSAVDEIGEKLSSIMEIYLPVLLYPGNIFGNIPTIRLPKSGSSIFLEAAQLLESLQDHHDVYGGAIFYQNKVVMSQLSVDITKQISITDPYRIKIPAKWISTSLNIPSGVQLLTVYINDDELNELLLHKMPNGFDRSNSNAKSTNSSDFGTDETDNIPQKIGRGLALVEEESDFEPSPTKNGPSLALMPDIVKDTVKLSADDGKIRFSDIKVESFVVDSQKNLRSSRCCSTDSLDLVSTSATRLRFPTSRYLSFKMNEEENPSSLNESCFNQRRAHKFFNTISDPTNTWFRQNGLPASKALREDHISLYCQDLNLGKEKSTPKQVDSIKSTGRKRPTNIDLNMKDSSKSKDLSLPPVKGFTETAAKKEVPLTPLMSKLTLMQVSEEDFSEALLTPASSLRCLNDESLLQKKKKSPRKSLKKSNFRSESRRSSTTNLHGCDKHLTKAVLFVCGYQNISTYLLLNIKCEKDPDFIQRLWKSCGDGVKNLERHFQQCFESIPQTQPLNAANDSYGYLHLHSRWDTLQHGGVWTPRQTDVVNTIREHFTNDTSLTDVTVRFEDCVIYGSQTADNQTYYQQQVEYIAGLPTPSDPMGLISLKAKRRLERDYGMLIL